MSSLKFDISKAIKEEGITPCVVTITSAGAAEWEQRGVLHGVGIPALFVYATFKDEIRAELRKRLFDKIIEVIRDARRRGDPVAHKVEEVILYDARGDPEKIIERKRVPD